MNSVDQIKDAFSTYLINTFSIDKKIALIASPLLNIDEQKQQFGDLNTNAALVLAKRVGKPPREIAQQIAQEFTHPTIEKIDIAGPGFLNFTLNQTTINTIADELFTQKETFFKPDNLKKAKVNIEFVSANPTGPLHFGHGRGGIIGDVLGNVLGFLGHNVTKEFYINDAGRQILKLGESLKARCEQIVGLDSPVPQDGYQGEYLLEQAKKCVEQYGDDVIKKPISFFSDYAKEALLAKIRETLKKYGINFNVWFSEKTLHDEGAIKQALDYLNKHNFLYEKDGALWFKSTEFGDDKDRVVRKANGNLTYAAADIAYLRNKIERGHNKLIMVLGHDHHSYAVRLQGILKALGLDEVPLSVILYQLVKIKASGEMVRMSKRAGNIVTLEDVINAAGSDVARFFYLHRKADAQLDFDLDLALKKTEDNPVYYVQYAYVRTNSILDKAFEHPALHTIEPADAVELGPEERLLIKKIVFLKDLLLDIDKNHQTHLLTYYVHELAQTFSKYYGKNRILDIKNIPKTRARLLMTIIVRNTLHTILDLLGVSKPEKM